jgi:hypothetical protein
MSRWTGPSVCVPPEVSSWYLASWPDPVGHIQGTLPRDLTGTDEKRRDLSRRSGPTPSTFAVVRNTPAPDPAYRPAQPLVIKLLYAEIHRRADAEARLASGPGTAAR